MQRDTGQIPDIRRPRFSLRLKLTIGVILIVLVSFSGLNVFNIYTHRKSLYAEAHKTRTNLARMVAAALFTQLADNELSSPRVKVFLDNFLSAAITQNKLDRDVAFGVVLDANNNVISGQAKPNLVIFPGGGSYPDAATALAEIAKLDGKLGNQMRTTRIPLTVRGRGTVGKLMIGISLQRINDEFMRDLWLNLSVFAAALILIIIYLVVTLGRVVIRPITQVMLAMRDVRKGNFNTKVELNSSDEIAVLADTYNFMVIGLREREELKDAFSRYVSTQVYDRLAAGDLTLTGETRNATVLFSDIRSFTALSERLTPADVVQMLNQYFNVMVEIVFKNDGFVNKFIGDALMAVYNVPIDQDEPEMRAVKTALEMIEALDEFNRARAEVGLFAVKIGIGINTGAVVAGNIGHQKRMEYTVIGDAVNLAQRIESQTKVTGMPILISESTYAAVADRVIAQALPPVKVKGKQEPVALYGVTALVGALQHRRPAMPIEIVLPPHAGVTQADVPPPSPSPGGTDRLPYTKEPGQ
ncbi:MAG: hypothetical protein A2341_24560 [Deltaproteobacteria bacterium RIFOXYB12_FULL_58_9]|nr:MAG: hypothetical protein A2341_24560 [Deltaproteobacteria bacterium RIFOXYB12_FULL_58_9]